MTYIRDRKELRTGYQEVAAWAPELDLQCDFVMAYGLNDTLQERVEEFRRRGYEVCLMTGCAWGSYDDYLSGKWDGKEHWEEAQTDRHGKAILHGVNTPYMVPTISFGTYLAEKLKGLVDIGIAAIFMEEPEFWAAGGYSKAFQEEYEAYYKEPWQAPHTSVDAQYRCAHLKTCLYARLIDFLSREVKTYSKEKYGRETGFYVATHSPVNYTQWKIMSPESKLLSMEHVDGFIAQIWSGTSGTGNVYQGRYKSRTFETAYLEYGSMQEMIHNTDKKMWFLHDPVEDFPENGWETYRRKYVKTVAASLFWQKVARYEVCPWPNRVFNGRYPKKLGMAEGMVPTTDMEGAKDIPREYATMLSGMVQLLGDMEQETYAFLGNELPVGILMSDTSLYQRSFPDEAGAIEDIMNEKIISQRETPDEPELYRDIELRREEFYGYLAGCTYPNFFGLTMPLLKHGLPLRPVYLEHIGRHETYLKDYRYLVLSYEYMKPEVPEYNETLAEWVKEGGCLIYIGDGSDLYHAASGWWRENDAYQNPAEHLFEQLGLPKEPENGTYLIGAGRILVWKVKPALLSCSEEYAKKYRMLVKQALFDTGYHWKETNVLAMERGPYRITAVLDEAGTMENSHTAECHVSAHNPASEEQTGCVIKGLFTDLLADGYPVVHEVRVESGEESILFDYSKIADDSLRVIATAARIEKLSCDENTFEIEEKAADRIHVHTRIRLPWQPSEVKAVDAEENPVELTMQWEEESRTVLLSYDSRDLLVKIIGTRG